MVMTADDVPSLYPEVREVKAPPGRGLHGYYRRGSNRLYDGSPDPRAGWLIIAPTHNTFRDDLEYKGCVFLRQYGQFRSGTTGGAPREQDARGNPWNPAMEQWRLLFQRGGAHEFPISQIIAYHWHLVPPYREAEFPQLADKAITDFQCPECERPTYFSSLSEREAAEQLRNHLMSKVNARHSYGLKDIMEIGAQWGINFGLAGVGKKPVRVKAVPVAADAPSLVLPPQGGMEMSPAEVQYDAEYGCAWCSWMPLRTVRSKAKAKRFHEARCKRNPKVAG